MDTQDLKNRIVRVKPIVDDCRKYLLSIEEIIQTEWWTLTRDEQFRPRGRSLHRVKKALTQAIDGLQDCQGDTLRVWLKEGGLI